MPDDIEIMRWEDEGGLPDLSDLCECGATSKFGGQVVWCPISGWQDHPTPGTGGHSPIWETIKEATRS